MFKRLLIERPTASKGTKSWFLLAISHSRSRFWQILNLQKIKISQKEQYGLVLEIRLSISFHKVIAGLSRNEHIECIVYFPQSYKAQGRSWRWENLFEKIIFTSFSLITYTISRFLHEQWPRLHEIKNRKGSKFKDNRPAVVPFSSRVIGKLHASFFENAERDLGRVANPKDNRNGLWCSLHCPPPRPNQKLQVTATRRIANSSRLHIRVTIWPGLLKAGWR